MNRVPVRWPHGKRFAFTIFDDPDSQTLEQCRAVYEFLGKQGLRTTMGVWILEPGDARRNSKGETCANPEYRAWAQQLQRSGFEIGFHNAAPATLHRDEILRGLSDFRDHFGTDPLTMANHYNGDAIYWGPARLTGMSRALYQAITLGRNRNKYFGEVPGNPSFWGDLCRERIRYCRNFVFRELNTLKACPSMPYRDGLRPFVNYWYASSEGANCSSFLKLVTSDAIDELESEGGAAIIYTHFGHGFLEDGRLNRRFTEVIERLRQRNGWFVPVGQLLGFLETQGNGRVIGEAERERLERKWLWHKLRYGTS